MPQGAKHAVEGTGLLLDFSVYQSALRILGRKKDRERGGKRERERGREGGRKERRDGGKEERDTILKHIGLLIRKTPVQILATITNRLPYDPAISFLGVYSKQMKPLC